MLCYDGRPVGSFKSTVVILRKTIYHKDRIGEIVFLDGLQRNRQTQQRTHRSVVGSGAVGVLLDLAGRVAAIAIHTVAVIADLAIINVAVSTDRRAELACNEGESWVAAAAPGTITGIAVGYTTFYALGSTS